MSLIILAGDGAFQISALIKARKEAFRAKFPSGEIQVLDGEGKELADLKNTLEARSLFAEDRLIIATGFMAGREVDDVEPMVELVRPDDSTILILVEKSLDKRTRLYNWLKKQPEFEEQARLAGAKLVAWAKSYADKIDLEVSSDLLETVIRYSAEEQFAIANNLDKLSLVGGPVSMGVLKELVQDESKTSSFSMLEAVFRGDSAAVEHGYTSLIDGGEEPHAILGLLAWQINMMVTASQIPPRERSSFAAEFKISDYAFSKAANLADKISKRDLKELLEATAKLDLDSKTKSIDMERALLAMLLKVASKF